MLQQRVQSLLSLPLPWEPTSLPYPLLSAPKVKQTNVKLFLNTLMGTIARPTITGTKDKTFSRYQNFQITQPRSMKKIDKNMKLVVLIWFLSRCTWLLTGKETLEEFEKIQMSKHQKM